MHKIVLPYCMPPDHECWEHVSLQLPDLSWMSRSVKFHWYCPWSILKQEIYFQNNVQQNLIISSCARTTTVNAFKSEQVNGSNMLPEHVHISILMNNNLLYLKIPSMNCSASQVFQSVCLKSVLVSVGHLLCPLVRFMNSA